MDRESARVGCVEPEDGHEEATVASPVVGPRERVLHTAAERRLQLATELKEQREDKVLDLHTARSAHYIDNAFSLVTANMAVVSLVLGIVYMSRPCAKPLASFLLILGMLAPFAACLPILVRQWFYLHLRLRNVVTIGLLATSVLYVVWLLLGQRWAFACSSKNCDQDLSTATNAVVFVLYVMLLLYTAKVVWYLALRARYSYKQLCLSCFQDPYPNALQLSDLELAQLERDSDEEDNSAEDVDEAAAKRYRVSGRSHSGRQPRKHKLLLDMQRHQRELRQSLHRLFQPASPITSDRKREKEKKVTTVPPATHRQPTTACSPGRSGINSRPSTTATDNVVTV